jgi:hypothetical protein
MNKLEFIFLLFIIIKKDNKMNPQVQQVYNPNSNGNGYYLRGEEVQFMSMYGETIFHKYTLVDKIVALFAKKPEEESIGQELAEENISHNILGHFGSFGLLLEMFSKLVDKDNPIIKLDFFTKTRERFMSLVNIHVFSEINQVFALLPQSRVKEKLNPNLQNKVDPKQIQTTRAHKGLWLGNPSKHPNYIPNKLTPSSSGFSSSKKNK